MPLNEDSSVLSAFREMGYVPVFSKKRGTRGNPESLKSLTEKFLIKIQRYGKMKYQKIVRGRYNE